MTKEELEVLEVLFRYIPGQTEDKDWWPDELREAMKKAEEIINKPEPAMNQELQAKIEQEADRREAFSIELFGGKASDYSTHRSFIEGANLILSNPEEYGMVRREELEHLRKGIARIQADTLAPHTWNLCQALLHPEKIPDEYKEEYGAKTTTKK